MKDNKRHVWRWSGWFVLCLVVAMAMTGARMLEAASEGEAITLTPATDGDLNSEGTDVYVDGGVQIRPSTPKVTAVSSNWLSVWASFKGDGNNNSYTMFDLGTSNNGPWTNQCGLTGESLWRHCPISNLSANTDYYVRLTHYDPDGVIGNPQVVVGPIHTPQSTPLSVKVTQAKVFVGDTSLTVGVPIKDDADRDSLLSSVEVATSNTGPWTQKCGPAAHSFAPKLCRIVGLTNGTAYYLRVIVSDPDGVVGPATQMLGPITYTGKTNLALNKPISATPWGWGCCSAPGELVDGRIQYSDWYYGFAWCGGLNNWGGCGPGWKSATIDLGSVMTVAGLKSWTHDGEDVPKTWKVEVSQDNVNFTQVFATSSPTCRGDTTQLWTGWNFASCAQSATFAPIAARYIRYSFDDTTLFNGIHGWQVELEVFGP